MSLAAFILANIEPIAQEWEEFAKTCIPASIGMSRSGLLDDVTRILQAVADDMTQPQTLAEQQAKGRSLRSSGLLGQVASSHVGLRIESRFDLAQIVSEYRAMRASVLRLWSESRPEGLSQDAMALIRFDEAIDQSVAEIVPTYLQRESQYRDRFFGMLGHDLRTPINAIQLSASALFKTGPLTEDGTKCVSRILNSSQRLDRMVQDILDFTRGRFGQPMYVNLTQVNFSAIFRGIIDEIQCANPDIVVELATRGDLSGECDGDRLSQLISNLVINAIQHGKAKQISIRMENENGQVLIEVHNDGLPIAQAAIATLFNPLGRERPSNHSQGSLGLGLFICQEIVKAHNGTITVTSSEDTGTTFAVRLNSRAGDRHADPTVSA
jgi:signal transduction histidine kinase